ncbi:MAG: hypothetical protein HQK75_10805, partial [Candidatus Magnetomorum sp.]|nr:hypothetical protein [Candidatus Magnetomorum sp.]
MKNTTFQDTYQKNTNIPPVQFVLNCLFFVMIFIVLEGSFTLCSGEITPGLDAFTKLMIHSNNDNGDTQFADSSFSNHTITTNGNVQHSTTKSKFGKSSNYYDGAQDYLHVPASSDFSFGTNNFTIDFWAYLLDVSRDNQGVLSTVGSINNYTDGWRITYESGRFEFRGYNTAIVAATGATYQNNTWYHIAVVRKDGTVKIYVDGVEKGSGTITEDIISTVDLNNGRTYVGYDDYYFYGYLDEIRVSNGIARWDEEFTPPDASYDAPVISDIPDQTISDSAESIAINFSITNTEADVLTIVCLSSNPQLVSLTGINIAESNANTLSITATDVNHLTITITPELENYGSSMITLLVTNAQGVTASKSFVLIVGDVFPGVDEFTKLMIHSDNVNGDTEFIDSSLSHHTITTYGNVNHSTVTSKFGKSSNYYDGAQDYLHVPASSDFSFGTNHFTIDFWAYLLDVSRTDQGILSTVGSINNYTDGWRITYEVGRFEFRGYNTAIVAASDATFQNNTWYHIAVVRKDGTVKIYVDGVEKGSGTITEDIISTVDLNNGRAYVGYDDYYFYGYLDEIRISNGIARWTENFTPPDVSYGAIVAPNTAPMISSITDTTISENTTSSPINFTFTDAETGVLTIECESSNPQLLSNTGITISDGNTSSAGSFVYTLTAINDIPLTMTVTPETEQSGFVTLTISVTDSGGLTAISSFSLTIVGENLYNEHTVLLLHMDDDQLSDSSPQSHTIAMVGNVFRSVGDGKFGDAAYFDGTSGELTVGVDDDFYFGTGDFTIDFWIKTQVYTDIAEPYIKFISSADSTVLLINRIRSEVQDVGGKLAVVSVIGGNNTTLFTDVVMNDHETWHHIALTRKDKTFYVFFDGSQVSSLYSDNSLIPEIFYIGLGGSETYFQGYIDELRIIKGFAVWSTEASFTPPTSPYNTPTISSIPDQTIVENSTSNSISFSVSDANEQMLTISYQSSNESLISESGITISGDNVYSNGSSYSVSALSTGTMITLSVIPETDQFGAVIITITVTSTQGISVSESFQITVITELQYAQSFLVLEILSDSFEGDTAFTDTAMNHTITNPTSNVYHKNNIAGNSTSIFFQGDGGYLQLDDSNDWELGDNFTIDFWMKLANTSEQNLVIGQTTSTATGWAVYWAFNHGILMAFADSGYGYVSDENPSNWGANIWYHINVVRENGVISIYRDGALIAGPTSKAYPITYDFPLVIGKNNYSGSPYYMNGYLDNIRIFKDIAVHNLYDPQNNPNGLFGNPPIITSISDQTISENSASRSISFTLINQDEQALTITYISSNESLISESGITFSGENVFSNGGSYTASALPSGTMITLSVTPEINQTGIASITITITNVQELSSSESFQISVLSESQYIQFLTVLEIESDTFDGDTVFIDKALNHTITNPTSNVYHKKDINDNSSSILFQGDGGYLQMDDSPDWELGANFTIDFWLKLSGNTGNYFVVGQTTSTNSGWLIYWGAPHGIIFGFADSGYGIVSDETPSSWETNKWYHVNIVRENGAISIFRNGVLIAGPTNLAYSVSYDFPLIIGKNNYSGSPYYMDGYLDNIRIIKDGVFENLYDPQNHPNGIYSISTLSDLSIIENSSSQSISFTVTDSNAQPLTITYSSSDESLISTNGISFSGESVYSNGSTYTVNATADGTLITLSVIPETNQSGTAIITITVTNPLGTSTSEAFQITVNDESDYYKLLIHSNNLNEDTTFMDRSGNNHPISVIGDTIHSNIAAKFGASSIYFDGTDDYLQLPDSDDWDFDGDFTIDFWVNFSDYKAYQAILSTASDGNPNGGFWFEFRTGYIKINTMTTPVINTSVTINTGQWYHFALVRKGSETNNTKLFQDGNLLAESTFNGMINGGTNNLSIGRYCLAANCDEYAFHGYLDEIRIAKGFARWSENFSPPDIPYTDTTDEPPQISSLSDQTIPMNTLTQAFNFSVFDSDSTALTLTITCDNNLLIPSNSNHITICNNGVCSISDAISFTISNSPSDLSLTIMPATSITGVAQITALLEDSKGLTSTTSMTLTVYLTENENDSIRLLIHSDNSNEDTNIIDSSDFNHSISVIGDTIHSTDQAKFGSSSLYFDGTGDYLQLADSADWDFDRDFTIDFWVNFSEYKTYQGILTTASDGNYNDGFLFEFRSGRIIVFNFSTHVVDVSGLTINTGVWYHFALVRKGADENNVKLFMDGVLIGESTFNGLVNGGANDFSIGRLCYHSNCDAYAFHGYLDELRISKNFVRWTEDFSVPDQPYGETENYPPIFSTLNQNDDKTVLLIHGEEALSWSDGQTFTESSASGNQGNSHQITIKGNATISNSSGDGSRPDNIFGSAIYFDGDADYLSIPTSEDWNLGTGDFTIDFWAKVNSGQTYYTYFANGGTGEFNKFMYFRKNTLNGNVAFQVGNGTEYVDLVITEGTDIDSYVWNHFAIVRHGSTYKLYLNGEEKASTSVDITINISNGNDILIGYNREWTNESFAGYMDEIRVSKGIARWTQNFSVPDSPYSVSLPEEIEILEEQTGTVNFSISDSDSDSISVSVETSDSSLIPVSNVLISDGTISNAGYLNLTPTAGVSVPLTITFTPETNQSGSVMLTFTLTDSLGLTTTHSFNITITEVNDPPTLASIQDQTTYEDIATPLIGITVTDSETTVCNLSLSMSSSNTELVPNEYILPACQQDQYSIVVTPAFNQTGTATISVTVTDNGGLNANTSFQITVNPDNTIHMWSDFQSADRVIGQTDFSTNSYGTSINQFKGPSSIAIDPTTGKLFVNDRDNNRILRFSSSASLSNGASAEAVFGQTNFTSSGAGLSASTFNWPEALFVDAFGRLWVSEHNNNRVLRFDNASSKENGSSADGVLGQPDFTTNSAGTTANKMNVVPGLWGDAAGTLWVSDYGNNRVLRFDNAAEKANGANADGVLGQIDFVSNTSGTTQNKLSGPLGIFADNSKNIFVTDFLNHRILRFDNASSKSDGANADGVLGQTDYISGSTGLSASRFYYNYNMVVDQSGNIYVSENSNNRILIFDNGVNKANGSPADHVLGQPDFTSATENNSGLSGKSIDGPTAIYFDNNNHHLWVTDFDNNRLLRFSPGLSSQTPVMSLINNLTIDENTVLNAFSFTISTATEQALILSYTSSNESLISSSGIIFSGDQVISNGNTYTVNASSSGTTITLTLSPETNQSGTAVITITVTDPQGFTATESFELTVAAVNDPPILSSIQDQTTNENISLHSISLTVTDAETAVCDLTLSMSSSNPSLFPNEYLLYNCDQDHFSIVATPDANQTGSAIISITVTDSGGLTAITAFSLTATEVDENQYYWNNFLSADLVLGQNNFTSNSSGATYTQLNTPASIATDPTTNKVFVSDSLNHRVLRFKSVDELINGDSAEAVLGQSDFVSAQPNQGGSVEANTMNYPEGIHVDPFGRLWVADQSNNRVLRFDSASSKTSGADADAVLGQFDFTSSTAGIDQDLFHSPSAIWFDVEGRLWIADKGNNRILRFDHVGQKENGDNADAVLGQSNYTSNTSGTTQNTFNQPSGIVYDNAGNLFISDSGNNRILKFTNAALKSNGDNADNVLGQNDFTSSANAVSYTNLDQPEGLGLDTFGHLYISDTANNRILIFENATSKTDGASADYVLGQPTFTTANANQYTVLLMHMDDDAFSDASAYSHPVSEYGNVTRSIGQGKFQDAAYFDGSGTYLNLSTTDEWNLGTGDFTVDFWAYIETKNTYGYFFGSSPVDQFNCFYYSPTDLIHVYLAGQVYTFAYGETIPTATWIHFAIVRKSSSLSCYVNGQQIGISQASTDDIQNIYLSIGDQMAGTSRPLDGYIDEFRILKGFAAWDVNFTVANQPYESASQQVFSQPKHIFYDQANHYLWVADSINNRVLRYSKTYNSAPIIDNNNLSLLLHMDDADLIDSSLYHHETDQYGGVTYNELNGKFGSSVYIDGVDDYITIPYHEKLAFATEDFTIDFWFYFENSNDYVTISLGDQFCTTTTYGLDWGISIRSGTYSDNFGLYYKNPSYTFNSVSTTVPVGSWHHAAFVRYGDSLMFFLDGVNIGTSDLGENYEFSDNNYLLYIGKITGDSGCTGTYYFQSYIDELRISKGIAHWTSNFTPPAFPYIQQGELLNPPEISQISDQTITLDSTSLPISFNVTDTESNALTIICTSSDSEIIGYTNLNIAASGSNIFTYTSIAETPSNFTLVISSNGNLTGTVLISLTVIDSQQLTSVSSFILTVTDYGLSIGQNTLQLLMHMDDEDLSDSSPYNHETTQYAGVTNSETHSKFGGRSLYLNGINHYITIPYHEGFALGSEDFTIDFWFYFENSNDYVTISLGDQFCTTTTYGLDWGISIRSGTYSDNFGLYYKNPSYTFNSVSTTVPVGSWHHAAFVRYGDSLMFFLDGVNIGTSDLGENYEFSDNNYLLYIGKITGDSGCTGTYYFQSYIDELRISKGIAHWTENFTPPSAPYILLDAPIISSISDQTISENTPSSPITFTATDAESSPCGMTLTMSSSDPLVIPDEYLLFACQSNQYSIVATPAYNLTGTSTISITLTNNNGISASTSFNVTVSAIDHNEYLWADYRSADLVIGQTDFTTNTGGKSDSKLYKPVCVAIDPNTEKVFVSDNYNHRVLRFGSVDDLTNGASAEAVFGQADFVTGGENRDGTTSAHSMFHPNNIYIDSFGHLWVPDQINNRVLRFDNASSTASDPDADGVLGQSDFISNSSGSGANQMDNPFGVWVDAAGRLWVSDFGNNRILRFDDAINKPDGASADGVLGQSDFGISSAGTSQNTMNGTMAVLVDNSGTLYVAEYYNNRVLRFNNAALKENGADADAVLGQSVFNSSSSGTTSTSLYYPRGLAIDSYNRLFVADDGNDRVLVYENASNLANGSPADNVLGQPDFITNGTGLSDKAFYDPFLLYYHKAKQHLWVGDMLNNRVLRFQPMERMAPAISIIDDTQIFENAVSSAINFTVTDMNQQSLTITYISSDENIISYTGIAFSGDQVSSSGNTYIVNATSVETTVTLTVTPETDQEGIASITIIVTDPDGMTQTTSFSLSVVKEQLVDNYTVLMLHGDNDFVDASLSEHIVTNHSITFADNHEGFGSSLYINGSAYLSMPDSVDWSYGNDDFTIDFWLKTTNSESTIIGQWMTANDSEQSANIGIYNSKLFFNAGNGSVDFATMYNSGPVINDNIWHHIAIVRNGNDFISFIDGNLIQTLSSTNSVLDVSVEFWIGAQLHSDGSSMNSNYEGYLDEIRISRGIARWTESFIPQVTQYRTPNRPPEFSTISDQTITENSTSLPITFNGIDEESSPCSLTLSMSSSDQSLISDEYLLYECYTNVYAIVATPLFNQTGTSTISLTLTDSEGLTACTSFNVNVSAIDQNEYVWADYSAADLVLGQTDFTTNTGGKSDTKLYKPVCVAIDPVTEKVFVSDNYNHRVLRFASVDDLTNGASAEAVFGQADFVTGGENRDGNTTANSMYHPNNIYIDSFGHLWVPDQINNRVLRFDNASSTASDPDADGVLGQPDLISNSSGSGANQMNNPFGVWVDAAGRLWVSDFGNNRILRFDDAINKPDGASADGVLGQSDFGISSAGTSQNTMNGTMAVLVDNSGTLYVAEYYNNRVLRFNNAALKENGADADAVLGHSDFNSSSSGTTSTGLYYPRGLAVDSYNRLFVADDGNDRVLVYENANTLSNGSAAGNVVGQPDFTTNGTGLSDKAFNDPFLLFYHKAKQHLWVGDMLNNRVLRFQPMESTAPTISNISDATIIENTTSSAISFTVTDINEQSLTITYQSSDENLISSSGIVFSGDQVLSSGNNYIVNATSVATTVTLTVTPETDQSGTAFITITVTDLTGMTQTTSFSLTVDPEQLVDEYTVLMLHGENDYVDTSLSEHVVTGNSVTFADNHEGFGSSFYLNGSTYLRISDSNDWSFGTDNFTIDFWIKTSVAQSTFFGQWTGSVDSQQSFAIGVYYSKFLFAGGNGSTDFVRLENTGPVIDDNNWHHVAVVRNGDNFISFVDGNLIQTVTSSDLFLDVSIDFLIGACFGSDGVSTISHLTGYVDEIRVSKGIARWTENFIPQETQYKTANRPPEFSTISDQTITENSTSLPITFTGIDEDVSPCSLTLSISSSDQSLIPDEYLLYECNSPDYSIVVTPLLNQTGTATISLTLTDSEGLAASISFNVNVSAIDHNHYFWKDNLSADLVLGQANFTSGASGTSASTLNSPAAIVIDPVTGKVFVSDRGNHRVLRFGSVNDLTNGVSAEAVLGQANFTSALENRGGSVAANTMNQPIGLVIDPFGHLWIADMNNHRILRFNDASSKSTGADADFVLGQTDFTTNTNGTSQNTMYQPHSVWFDPVGRLWVADYSNHRVLRFNDVYSKSNGANADGVLGQSNFSTGSAGLSQSTFNMPVGLFIDNSDCLLVVDQSNRRILGFDNVTFKSDGGLADRVFGQTDFVSNTSSTTDTIINIPIHGIMDNTGRLYFSDFMNNRILIYNDILNKPNGSAADNVLGQPDFVSNTANNGGLSAKSLNAPFWMFFDKKNNQLWVAEYYNHRVLRYSLPEKKSPVLSTINDFLMSENTVSTSISFTVTDVNEQSLTITYQSSDENIISSTGISFSGDQVSSGGNTYIVNATSVA